MDILDWSNYWWSLGNISDEKFIENMEYMIKKEINSNSGWGESFLKKV